MCSNNNAYSSGGVGGGAASLRKSKRQRVPKRGPGVAELEKILREQESRDVDHLDKGKLEGFSSSSSSSCLLPNAFQYSHNSLMRNVPFVPDQTHFSNATGNVVANVNNHNSSNANNACSGNYGNRGCRGIHTGASGTVLPEKVLIPASWGSGEQQIGQGEGSRVASGFQFPTQLANGSDQSHMFVSQPLLDKKHCHFQPSMVNFFLPPVFVASSTPFSAGMYHHVEPPSNQRLPHQNCNSTWPKEDKAAASKRQWPFPSDNHPVAPPFACQPPPWPPSMHMPGSSSSTGNSVIFNLGTSSSSLCPKMEKCVTDSGAPNTSFFPSSSSPLPPAINCQQEFPKLGAILLKELKEGCEESHQRLSADGSIQQKPYYSFLPHEQQLGGAVNTIIGFANERSETRDGIDLNLKL